ALIARLREAGFIRVVAGGRIISLADKMENADPNENELLVIVDRLMIGQQTGQRLRDSLETAFRHGDGRAVALVDDSVGNALRGVPGAAVVADSSHLGPPQ